MRKQILLLAVLIIGLSATSIFAQARKPFTNDASDGPQDLNRTQVMRELGLTKDQLQEIRRINQENRPQKEAAAVKFREAKNALDAAIYNDDVNENEIRERLRAVSDAQTEMNRINTLHELAVRRILTKEQLTRFREFRKSFADRKEMRKELPKRVQNRRQRRNANRDDDTPPPRPPV